MTATLELPTRDAIPFDETWDLSVLFPSAEAWESGMTEARTALEQAAQHQDHLGDSLEALHRALTDLDAAKLAIDRVITWAALSKDEDTGDSERGARYERAISLAIEAGQRLAYVQPELLAIDPPTLDGWIAEPLLDEYRFPLQDSVRHRPHTRSLEVETLLAQAADVQRTASDAFDKLTNADLDFGVTEDDDGQQLQLSLGRYQQLLESKNRDVRRQAFQTYTSAFKSHLNTLASLHAGSVRSDVFSANARNYPSTLESALFGNNVPLSVYESLIAAVRSASPAIEKFLDLRREMLGISEGLAFYDLNVPLSPLPERMFTIPEAVETTLRGIAPLGETYQRDLKELFDQRMVDWHETRGKRSGAYSWGSWRTRPVILMNWNGTTDHVFTLAHEAGHAMHTYYAAEQQPYATSGYSIFAAEIASTVNEVFLTWSLLAETPADAAAERFAILNRFADTIWGTLIRQTMFAEFEMRTHESVERGEPLTADSLSELFTEMVDVYTPGIEIDEFIVTHWSRIPHFYNAFYVFQYATGISAAIAMATRIREEGEPAQQRYLEFLAAGGSDYPLPLLQAAGVDLTTPAPVEAALQEFDETVTQMRELWESGVLAG